MLIVRLPLCGAGNHLAQRDGCDRTMGEVLTPSLSPNYATFHVTPLGVPAMSPGNEVTKCTSSSRTRRRSTDRLLSAGGARPLVVSEERAEASSGSWAGGGSPWYAGSIGATNVTFPRDYSRFGDGHPGRRQIGSGGWADRGRHSNNGSAFWKGRPAGCRRLTTAPRVNEERNTPHMRFRMLP